MPTCSGGLIGGNSDEVRRIQLSSSASEPRNVFQTVRRHLMVAGRKYFGTTTRYDCTSESLKEAKVFLEDMSAHEFPPSLAGFAGMGSNPNRLYKSIGFDKLHVIEHGILRYIPDDAYKVFETAVQYHGLSKAEIVKVANQIFLDAPRAAQLPRFQPFRRHNGEKAAGVSGKMRRESAPFLWYSLMGIPTKTDPDDDPLVQLLLMTDKMQQLLLGIIHAPSHAHKSEIQINELGALCFEVGKLAANYLQTFVTTKLHRIMRHTSDHFFDYGCIRKGSTDQNETLHKYTKKAYRSTNKHLTSIAPQLLKSRVVIEQERVEKQNNADSTQAQIQLLLTRTPLVKEIQENSMTTGGRFIGDGDHLRSLLEEARGSQSAPDDVETKIIHFLHPSSNLNVWFAVKSARFKACIPWWPDHQIWQTVYAGDVVFGCENRHDAVVYTMGEESHFGIIQSIFTHRSARRVRIALVRRLEEVPAERGNGKVVEHYGNRRFAYAWDSEDVQLDLDLSSEFIRSAMIVPDPWVVCRQWGTKMRMKDLLGSTRYTSIKKSVKVLRASRLQVCFFGRTVDGIDVGGLCLHGQRN